MPKRDVQGNNHKVLNYPLSEFSYKKCRDSWNDGKDATSSNFRHSPSQSLLSRFSPSISVSSKTLTLREYLLSTNIALESFSSVNLKIVSDAGVEELYIPPFCGFMSNEPDDDIDIYLNCSGPISCTKFCPAQNSCSNLSFVVGQTRIGWPQATGDYETDSKAATATEPFANRNSDNINCCIVGTDLIRSTQDSEHHDNLFQVWHVNCNDGSSDEAVLDYFVRLERKGSVVDVAWSNINFNKNDDLIGVVALVCGNGECLVYAILRQERINLEKGEVFDNIQVFDGANLLIGSIIENKNKSWVTSVSWSNSDAAIVYCGMSNGSVTVWSFQDCMLYSDKKPSLIVRLSDSMLDCRIPSTASLNCVKECPYDPDLLLSCGNDGKIKIWDLNRPFSPIYSRNAHSSLRKILWDECRCGIYHCETETSNVSWDQLWFGKNFSRARSALYCHRYKFGAIWDFTHFVDDCHSVLFSASADGTVRGGYVSSLALLKTPNEGLMEVFQINSVEQEGDTAKVTVTIQPKTDNFRCNTKSVVETNILAISSIDHLQKSKSHILLYGCVSGIARLHSIQPKLLLTGK